MTDPPTATAAPEQVTPSDKPTAVEGSLMEYNLTEDGTHSSNISTTAVKKYFNILDQLNDSQVQLASSPYQSLKGSSPTSFCPDLQIVTLYAAKVLTGKETLTDFNQELYLRNGLTLEEWTGCMTAMTNNSSSSKILTNVLIQDPGLVESRYPASAIQSYNVHTGQQSGYIPFEHCHLDMQHTWPTASLQPPLSSSSSL
jgi:hypothetical protein